MVQDIYKVRGEIISDELLEMKAKEQIKLVSILIILVTYTYKISFSFSQRELHDKRNQRTLPFITHFSKLILCQRFCFALGFLEKI